MIAEDPGQRRRREERGFDGRRGEKRVKERGRGLMGGEERMQGEGKWVDGATMYPSQTSGLVFSIAK